MERAKPARPTSKLGASDLLAFRAITSFITELGKAYGNKQRSLALYARLIEKTNIMHEENISKHVEAFRRFCVANRVAIKEQKLDEVKVTVVNFSERVFVNIAAIMRITEEEDIPVIWEHLATISAILDPEGGIKKVMHSKETLDLRESVHGEGREDDLLREIIDTVGVSLGKGEDMESASKDPTKAVNNMMNSGVLGDLMKNMTTGMESGELDLTKLMGSIQGMVCNMGNGTDVEIPEEISSMTENLNKMIRSVSGKVEQLQEEHDPTTGEAEK